MTLEQLFQRLSLAVGLHDIEVCGLLFGPFESIPTHVTGLDIKGIMPVPNIAPDPTNGFEFDHEILREQWRLRRGDVLGIFHSHPFGPAIASQPDRELVIQTGLISVIIGVTSAELRVYGRYRGDVIEIGHWNANQQKKEVTP